MTSDMLTYIDKEAHFSKCDISVKDMSFSEIKNPKSIYIFKGIHGI
jgi:hypothetical protein